MYKFRLLSYPVIVVVLAVIVSLCLFANAAKIKTLRENVQEQFTSNEEMNVERTCYPAGNFCNTCRDCFFQVSESKLTCNCYDSSD